MSVLVCGLLILAGIVLLIAGGELFVAGSVAVALILLPTLQGDDDLALSSVVGSNIVTVLVGLTWQVLRWRRQRGTSLP